MSATPMTMLFSELSLEDSSAIIKDLERQAIPFELRNDGALIMVPRDRLAGVRDDLVASDSRRLGALSRQIQRGLDEVHADHRVALLRQVHREDARPAAQVERPPAGALRDGALRDGAHEERGRLVAMPRKRFGARRAAIEAAEYLLLQGH